MERIYSSELPAHVGERVLLAGWVHAKRELGSVSFLVVRDRAGVAQVVLDASLELLPESVVEVEGVVVAAEQAPGGVELRTPEFRALAVPVERPPIELRRPELKETLPTILDHAPVALRHPRLRARFEIAAASLDGFRAALDRLGFTEISTPKIVAAATESGATVFALDYFGRRAYLAQSPQLYKQTMVGVFERVYETGPVFRAEPHDTGRHLAEYTSLDAELGFIRDHFDVMAVVRVAVAGMVEAIRERAPRAVELLEVELPEVPPEIPWLHFADSGVDDVDLAPADERRLCEEQGEFVFVSGLEIVTGGQRLHRYDDYVAALGGATGPYDGYLQAFRYGMPRHGGFALGLARWVADWSGWRTFGRRRCSRAT